MYQYEVIYVSKSPFIKHEILTFSSGLATHNHPDKQIILERVDEAIEGRRIVERKIIRSPLSELEIITRMRGLADRRRYAVSYNCEDYIAELFGNPPTSKQRNFWVVFGLIGLGLVATR